MEAEVSRSLGTFERDFPPRVQGMEEDCPSGVVTWTNGRESKTIDYQVTGGQIDDWGARVWVEYNEEQLLDVVNSALPNLSRMPADRRESTIHAFLRPLVAQFRVDWGGKPDAKKLSEALES